MTRFEKFRVVLASLAVMWGVGCAKSSDQEVGAAPDRGDTTAVTTQVDTSTGEWDTNGATSDVNAPPSDTAPEEAAELEQGRVSISTTDGATYQVALNESIIGSTPNKFTQRRGTERTYSIQDESGRVICRRTVAIKFAYQIVELVCNPKSGEFMAKGSSP